jgi:two-component system, NarL family, response regulator LiaR
MRHVRERGVRVLMIDNDVIFVDALVRHCEGIEHAPILTRIDADANRLRAWLAPIQPDVVTLDPEEFDDPVDVVTTVSAASPQSGVLVLTMSHDSALAARLAQAGALGWVGKDEPVETLFEAIAALVRGEARFPPQLLGVVMQMLLGHARAVQHPPANGHRTLTEREREILAHILAGETSREIAHDLKLSMNTIRSHRRRIGAKLGV